MKKLILATLCICLMGCTQKKPELAPTQIVDGVSIVMPPEFHVLPIVKTPTQTQLVTKGE